MATVKRTTLKTPSKCNCAKPQLHLEFDFPLEKEDLEYFISNGYTMVISYINIGICYIEDINLIAIGPFGSNKLQIKCKNPNCEESIVKFEELIKNIR